MLVRFVLVALALAAVVVTLVPEVRNSSFASATGLVTCTPAAGSTIQIGETVSCVADWSGNRPATVGFSGFSHSGPFVAQTAGPASITYYFYDYTGPTALFVSSTTVDFDIVGAALDPAPPTIASISPDSYAGDGPKEFTIHGTGFEPGLFITVDGQQWPSTRIDSETVRFELYAQYGERLLLAEVHNPSGRVSNAGALWVRPPLPAPPPVIESATPLEVLQNEPYVDVFLTGSGFTGMTRPLINGTSHAEQSFRLDSPTTWMMGVQGTFLTTVGTVELAAENLTPGGGPSNSVLLHVVDSPPRPQPEVTALSPASVGIGQSFVGLTVVGSGFSTASKVLINGTSHGTAYISDTMLQTAFDASALTQAPGVIQVTVTSPPPGGGVSSSVAMQVVPAAEPRVDSIAPVSGPTSGGTNVIITGAGFTNATAVTFGETQAASVTVISDSFITAISPAHPAGVVDIVIAMGDQVSAPSASSAFTYVPPSPAELRFVDSQGNFLSGPLLDFVSTGSRVRACVVDAETLSPLALPGITLADMVFIGGGGHLSIDDPDPTSSDIGVEVGATGASTGATCISWVSLNAGSQSFSLFYTPESGSPTQVLWDSDGDGNDGTGPANSPLRIRWAQLENAVIGYNGNVYVGNDTLNPVGEAIVSAGLPATGFWVGGYGSFVDEAGQIHTSQVPAQALTGLALAVSPSDGCALVWPVLTTVSDRTVPYTADLIACPAGSQVDVTLSATAPYPLGLGSAPSATAILRLTIAGAAGLTHPTTISAGGSHSLALDEDGELWFWGSDLSGQLPWPRPLRPHLYAFPAQLVTLDGGGYFSMGMTASGDVWTWGYDAYGQMGNGPGGSPAPFNVLLQAPAVAVSAGSSHAFALLSDGTLWAWGMNDRGQLGLGYATPYPSDPLGVESPQLAALTDVVAIAAAEGGAHTLALKSDGTVWGWGEPTAILTSLPGGGWPFEPVVAPQQVPGLANVSAIAAAGYRSYALRSDGTVWQWDAWNGLQQVPGLPVDIIAITAGPDSAHALTGAGIVYGWGDNYGGSVGDGTFAPRSTAVQVTLPAPVVQISDGGGAHSLALLADGRIFAWGANSAGVLGIGTEVDTPTPTQVLFGPSDTVTCSGEQWPTRYPFSISCSSDLAPGSGPVTWTAVGLTPDTQNGTSVSFGTALPEDDPLPASWPVSIEASWTDSQGTPRTVTMPRAVESPASCSGGQTTSVFCSFVVGGNFGTWSATGFSPEVSGSTWQEFTRQPFTSGTITATFAGRQQVFDFPWVVPPPPAKRVFLAWAGQRVILEHDWRTPPGDAADVEPNGSCPFAGPTPIRYVKGSGPGNFVISPGVGFVSFDEVLVTVSPSSQQLPSQVPFDPQGACISRALFESEDPGQVDVEAFPDPGDPLSPKVAFVVYYMKLESVSLSPETGVVKPSLNATNGDFAPGNPWQATPPSSNPVSWNVSTDLLVRGRVKGWFVNSILSGRPADDSNPQNVLPAGRWVMPDDWALLAGGPADPADGSDVSGPAEEFRPYYDLMSAPNSGLVCFGLEGLCMERPIGEDTVSTISGPFVGPYSVLDIPGISSAALGSSLPFSVRETILRDGDIDMWDAPMPPALVSVDIRGAGYLRQVRKQDVYYLGVPDMQGPGQSFPNLFYRSNIPDSPFIPAVVVGGGYFWDSWGNDGPGGNGQGAHEFWTPVLVGVNTQGAGDPTLTADDLLKLEGIAAAADDSTIARTLVVYSDNHGEFMVAANGRFKAAAGSCQADQLAGTSTISAVADYPDFRGKHFTVASNLATVNWTLTPIAVPTLEPDLPLVGSQNVTITVTGGGWFSQEWTQACIDGVPVSTTVDSPGQLTVAIPNHLLDGPGTHELRVAYTSPGYGVTPPVTFSVEYPRPTLTTPTPLSLEASAAVGARVEFDISGFMGFGVTSFTVSNGAVVTDLVITGTGSNARVSFVPFPQGSDPTTTVNPGTYEIRASNPAPGGGTSNVLLLFVIAPVAKSTLSLAVLDDSGGPVAGATVQLTSEEPNPGPAGAGFESRTLVTDSLGAGLFGDLSIGRWRYSVSAPGYGPVAGAADVLPEGTTVSIILEPSMPELGVTFTVEKTSIQDRYITTIDLAYAPSVSIPALQLIPGILSFNFACEGGTLPGSVRVKNPGSVVMSDVRIDTGASNQATLQFRQTSPALMLAPGEEGIIYFTVTGVPGASLPPAGLFVRASYRQFNQDQTLRRGVPVLVTGSCFDTPPPDVTFDGGGVTIRIEGPVLPDWSFGFWRSSASGGGGSAVADGGVRVRLSQELAIEREAFLATLKLSNPSGLEARDIRVTLSAATPTGELVTTEFGITDPELTGELTSVGGTGVLPPNGNGEARWTLIPSAILGGDDSAGRPYLVQAQLSYRIGNVDFEVTTLPEAITVTPQPELELYYTVNERVTGGVFTVQLEIRNVGKGVARNVTVASLMPELLSNASGVPLSFAIVGSQLGLAPRTSSPNLAFGDIAPGQSLTGRFFGTASEDGYFTEVLSASITQTNFRGVILEPLITKISVVLKDPSAIVGSVRQPDGTPVPGATVTVRWWAEGVAALQASGTTNADGGFSVGVDLQGGQGTYVFEVDAERPGYWIPARRIVQLTEVQVTPVSPEIGFIALDADPRLGTSLWDPQRLQFVSVGYWSPAGACAGKLRPLSFLDESCAGIAGIESKLETTTNLVFVTHGWCGVDQLLGCPEGGSWSEPLGNLARSIATATSSKPWAGDWELVFYDWGPYAGSSSSLGACVEDVRLTAEAVGRRVGGELHALGYDYVHFVAHSAGSWLIDRAADALGMENQQTYLDSFLGCLNLAGVADALGINPLGENALWSEQYFSKSIFVPFTNWELSRPINVDVSLLDQAGESHGWPITWYANTVSTPTLPEFDGFGFGISKEWTNIKPSMSDFFASCGGTCSPGQVINTPESRDEACDITSDTLLVCAVNILTKPLYTFNHFVRVGAGVVGVTFSAIWPGSDVRLSLISPSGRVVDRSTNASDVVHILGPTSEFYSIANPEAGEWRAVLFGLDVDPLGEATIFQALEDKMPPAIAVHATKPDGSPYVAGTWSNQSVAVHFTCTDAGSGVMSCPADWEYSADGAFTRTGTATDGAGNTASASFGPVHIDRTPPSAAPTAVPAANGAGWNKSDVDIVWNWSDSGSGIDAAQCTTTSTSSGEGTLTVAASCRDLAGNTGTSSHTVKVDNTPPSVTIASPTDLSVNPAGLTIAFSATDDISGVDLMAATLTNSTAASATPVTSGAVISVAGVYTVAVTAADRAGNVTTQNVMFVVYDPAGSFVSGGGWIDSPAGAYAADPALTGKGTFGFVSQYKKGQQVPSGNTEFQFRAGGLAFKSTSYEWLVVAGSKAQFRGRGTINGQGDYAFFLTAIDGDSDGANKPDKFRIRIWDRLNGGLVYDNQLSAPDDAEPTTVLGGGSIVVHR
ncbi:MAG: IPT/TIG domain-containing protein [Dehalococcoidia bacterium]|nr:IPT/TIG domain-containing protein [Dehalococcoidia bacterium]